MVINDRESVEYHHALDAFCACRDRFEQSALRCMMQGLVPYDKDFCDKYYSFEKTKKRHGGTK